MVEKAQPDDVTRLLVEWSRGKKESLDLLMPLVYRELHKLAGSYLRGREHTLQPTALIHEAYLRLVDQTAPEWQSRSHFFGIASRVMRNILVDYARKKFALKRGAGQKVTLNENMVITEDSYGELLAIDQALQALAAFDERKSRIIEMRYFGGMSMEETAEAMSLSLATVRRQLRLAEAWLRRELGQ